MTERDHHHGEDLAMRGRLNGLAGWVVAGVILLVAAARPGAEEIRARRLVIEDSKGRDLIVMQEKDGCPEVTLLDAHGPRMFLSISDDDTVSISMTGPKTKGRVMLGVTPTEAPYVSTYDGKGAPRILNGR